MKLKILPLVIGFMVMSNCSTRKSNDQLPVDGSVEDNKTNNHNNDTLQVAGKTVIFFGLSQQEYDSLVKDANFGIDEVVNDFNYYVGVVADSIKKAGYTSMVTRSRYIQIKFDDGTYRTYDRLAKKHSTVGYIFSDGRKEPKIGYGVGTDIDILMDFKDFRE